LTYLQNIKIIKDNEKKKLVLLTYLSVGIIAVISKLLLLIIYFSIVFIHYYYYFDLIETRNVLNKRKNIMPVGNE